VRCHYLVTATAPLTMTPRHVRVLLDAYVADRRRGRAVWHDHFADAQGGAVVLEVRDPDEQALLSEPGQLDGWRLDVRRLLVAPPEPLSA
jgi:hypothetical protein